MSQIDKGEKDSEDKHRHVRELDFKVQARCNKLLGVWGAEKVRCDGAADEAYAKEVIASDFDKPSDD